MADHRMMKLGKHPPRHDPRNLLMAKYLAAPEVLPAAPPSVTWSAKVSEWPMYSNDKVGDCTCAGIGHMIEAWSANAGALSLPSDSSVLQMYENVTGYNPALTDADGNNPTDNGANETDVLNYMRSVGLGGHKVDAYVSVNPASSLEVKQAIYLFGGLYIGLALPLTAQRQEIWDCVAEWSEEVAPGSWGGHAVNVVDYAPDGHLTVVTWGALKEMTNAFWLEYCDEAWAIVSRDFFDAQGHDPAGFDFAQLTADLQAIGA